MSVKRQATTDLNHDNWDQDDPNEHEEMGTFKTASKDVLEKRVIRTAKRRSQISSDEPKQSVFSGFGGFNKTQPSSFDFLANLTNGSNKSISPTSKSDTTVTSTIFNNLPLSNNSGNSIFGMQTSTSTTKPMFGITSTQASPVFDSTTTSTISSVFTASKADSTVGDSPFKIQVTSSSSDSSGASIKTINANSAASVSQVSSTIFGIPTSSTSKSTLFTTTSNSTLFTAKPVSSTTTVQAKSESLFSSANTKDSNISAENKNHKKLNYYSKLKGLNESVSAWITKHVDETPLCILTPIFRDYEKYLKDIQDEYQNNEDKPPATDQKVTDDSQVTSLGTKSSPLTSKSTGFSFGTDIKPVNNENPSKPSFTFGMTSHNTTPVSSSLFSNTANTNGSAPFSFGIGKPFTFNSNIQTTSNETSKATNENENEDDDSPPKVEFKPIVEENSIYDKRCKIFVKKEDNFVDKGVGTLYIKKIEETGKHQLLVRANTNLGNVLLNLILSSAVPIQRTGKNNVTMVCIPTPDTKPPPVPILIRVKTSEEADELLETLNKYKT
ncbi:nuclear pore complex protein Nup50 [Galleria mellonella]|uniref:Nuclear pore complex protein Nup50 n=1 Tax=Galleria mellonella TaxID=7137 RepID=A0A6J1X606_GALME|nr:nuclear pore complex protein Nup50 [Galleria mellonella]